MRKHQLEIAALILVSAVLYWLSYELQGWLFQFTEHVPGVNWFYLPAGLRVMLVLVAGLYGALGIFAATIVIDLLHMKDLNGVVLLLTAVASGFGAWVALWLMRWRGLIDAGLTRLTSTSLIQYALMYSLFNALFHQAVWWASRRDGAVFLVDVWPMFVGDLLGAAFFLYGLKVVMKFSTSPSLNKSDLLN
ncbi:MAG: hypothetical protein ACKO0Z_27465 [Betaproteobacteria bacterium]